MGPGSPRYRADVGIRGDRIARIGTIHARGREEVDARHQVVAPGFIDGHTHMDAQVAWDPLGTCSCWHGVTSVVMGNCGFTLAPCRPDEKHLVVRNLERAEDISAEAMAAGIEWTWETYAEYLDAVARRPKGINYAGYVGHSALRTYAMGEPVFTEPATAEDLAVMQARAGERARRGGDRVHHVAHAQPRDGGPAARGQPRRRVERGAGAGAGDGRPRGGIFEIAGEDTGRDPDAGATTSGGSATSRGDRRAGHVGMFSSRFAPDAWRAYFAMLDETARAGGRSRPGDSRSLALVSRSRRGCPSIAYPSGATCARARSTSSAPSCATPKFAGAGEGSRRGGVRPSRRRRGSEAGL